MVGHGEHGSPIPAEVDATLAVIRGVAWDAGTLREGLYRPWDIWDIEHSGLRVNGGRLSTSGAADALRRIGSLRLGARGGGDLVEDPIGP